MESLTDENHPHLIDLTAGVVSAFVSNNSLQTAELPELLENVHAALRKLVRAELENPPEELKPSVPVEESVFPDFIISLEDGSKHKVLRRHLQMKYDMTPDQYRAKWRLPEDYPMIAPNYAKIRSALAKKMGLGRHARKKPGKGGAASRRTQSPLGRQRQQS